jgi:hypothetical protein
MPEHDLNTLLGWRGRTVLDRKGETIGKLGDLYLDEATDRAAYAGIRTGLLGRHESTRARPRRWSAPRKRSSPAPRR